MFTYITACAAEAEIDEKAIQPKANISSILFDAEFLESVKKLLEILNPIAELTNFCQKSTTSAADAAEKWLELYEIDSSDLHGFVENRLKKSNVLNTVTMTANFLHPVYRGKRLNHKKSKLKAIFSINWKHLGWNRVVNLRKMKMFSTL